MVVITCNCLNVKLSSKQNPNTAVFEFLTDSGSENTPFYPNKVLLVEVIDPGITIEQDYLVHRQPIGEWLVHSCLNCGLDVYATKPRSSRLLINQKVQYDPAVIDRLHHHPNYSDVFELVLPEKDTPFQTIPDRSSGQFESLQGEINMVQEQLTNYLIQEETEMENRIKHYEEEQRILLQQLQEKVRKDKKKMISVLLEAQKQKMKGIGDNTGSKSVSKSPERLKPKGMMSQKTALSRAKSTPVPRGQSLEDYDQNADGLFMFDGGDVDSEEQFYQSDDESESEEGSDRGERKAPSTMKKNKLIYSASVPISVPTWCPGIRDTGDIEEFDEDGSLPTDPENIAASMQALAQSIHNDERYIFGERPRPRLNTGDFTNQ